MAGLDAHYYRTAANTKVAHHDAGGLGLPELQDVVIMDYIHFATSSR